MELDPTDRALVRLLQEDARLSFRELARRVGVSTPTAAARVRALERIGLVRAYRAVLDPTLLGRAVYVADVRARPAAAPALAERLASWPGVESALAFAGGRVHARLLAEGADEVRAFVDRLHAEADVEGYDLLHALGTPEAAPVAVGPGARLTVVCHECQGPIHGTGVHRRFESDGQKDHWFCCRNCAGSFEDRLRQVARRARRPR